MRSPHRRHWAATRGGAAVGFVLSGMLALIPAAASASGTDGAGAAEEDPSDRITDLGTAMHAPNVRLSDVDVLADGTPVGYLFSDGEPVSFDVVDLRTGDLIDSHELPPYSVASSITVAEDETVYLSVRSPNDGTLWRYDPNSAELTEIATNIAGEQMLRTLDVDGETLYGTTYPNATVYKMDLATEEFTTFDSIAPESDYAWGLEAHEGELWAGAGLPAQLYSVDPDSGEASAIELPADVAEDGGFVQRIESYEDIKVVSHQQVDGDGAQVYDGNSWVDSLPISGMWLYTEQTADGSFYYLDTDGQPVAYDVAEREATRVDLDGSGVEDEIGETTRLFLADLGTEELPGQTLLGVRADGQIWRYNLQTGRGDVLATQAEGTPVTTMSIAEGGDDNVYVGAYLSPGVMARVDVETEEIEQLDGPEQADAITAHGDQTVVATYPGAGFHVAESDEPWQWGENPRHLFTLGREENGQDRPRHMISAGDLVAAGTISTYGELGGALTLFDPDTGAYEMHRDVVTDQSVTDLAYADGVVYGGTTIHGGLDSTPTQDTAELFVWDLEEGLQEADAVVEGAEVIHALTIGGSKNLWGMADTGTLFEYDTATGEVVRTIDTGIPHSNTWGSNSELDYNPDDGQLYASAGGQLLRVDPEDGALEVLVEADVQRSTVAAGDVFYTNETNIFRYDVPTPDLQCDEELIGTHNGPLTLNEGTTCIEDATLRGPVTVSDGASVVVTDSSLHGPFRGEGANAVTIRNTSVNGPVFIENSTGPVGLAGNEIAGPLMCEGNTEAPTDNGEPNSVRGPAQGQCADLAG